MTCARLCHPLAGHTSSPARASLTFLVLVFILKECDILAVQMPSPELGTLFCRDACVSSQSPFPGTPRSCHMPGMEQQCQEKLCNTTTSSLAGAEGSLCPCSANPCTCRPKCRILPFSHHQRSSSSSLGAKGAGPLTLEWMVGSLSHYLGHPRALEFHPTHSLAPLPVRDSPLMFWTHTALSPPCSRAGVSSSRHIRSSSDVLCVVNFSLPRLPHPPPVPPPYGHS